MEWKEQINGCWIWKSTKDRDGYGLFKLGGKMVRAHRLAWALRHGIEAPEGKCVLHHCDNPSCVNPDHLFLGTRVDNQRDMMKKGRAAHGEKNSHSKLTEAQVISIKNSYPSISQASLAKMYGVNDSAINKIVNGERWVYLG